MTDRVDELGDKGRFDGLSRLLTQSGFNLGWSLQDEQLEEVDHRGWVVRFSCKDVEALEEAADKALVVVLGREDGKLVANE